MDRYNSDGDAEMEKSLCELLFDALESAGWLVRDGAAVVLARERMAGAPSFFERWLEESLAALGTAGLLIPAQSGAFSTNAKRLSSSHLWRRWNAEKASWLRAGMHAARIALAEASLRALPQILTGKKRATDVMFPDASTELVTGVYRDNYVSDYFNDVLAGALLTLVEARRRLGATDSLKVLEVGAGTGATTDAVMARLAAAGQQLDEYCFTDLSRSFLRAAQSRFSARIGPLQTRRLDVEQSPFEQGFAAADYDFVIAANVLHATANIRVSLRNVKALLKPHGVLLINELSAKTLFNHLTFGLLEGWWRYEDDALRIPGSPLLSPDRWTSVLHEEGFSQVVPLATNQLELGQQILAAESDGFVRTAAARKSAQTRAPERATAAAVEKPSAVPPAGGAVTSQMIHDHVTDQLSDALADALKMSPGDLRPGANFLEYGVDSLVAVKLINRVNRLLGLTLPTTVLFNYSTINQLARHIAATFAAEIAARLGVPTSHAPPSAPVEPSRSRQSVSPANYRSGTYRRVLLAGPMTIDSVALSEAHAPALSPTQVCVSTRAFALNFADLLCIQGLYATLPEYPFTPGMDAAGVVVAVGDAVTAVSVGDEVITGVSANLGAHATMIVVEAEEVFKKPAGITFEDACVLNTSTMAIIAAFQRAALQPGESILIQSATGGVGLTAVQLAKHYGATVFATAGSRRKVEYLHSVGVDHAIDYVESDFQAEVARLTNGRGVDVVINTLPGEAIQKGMHCLAPGGRYIELAAVGLKAAKAIDLSILAGNKTVFALDIRALHRHSPQALIALHDDMLRLYQAGAIAPSIGRIYDFNELPEAYEYLASRQSIGKIVVRVAAPDWFSPTLDAASATPRARNTKSASTEGIAIVGVSGRFARSRSLDEFWTHLTAGRSLIERATRWDLSASKAQIGDAQHPYCDYGSFLEGIGAFDPLFFEISGAEAACMDPQQRLFLEECWKALEDAGYAGSVSDGSPCGVYVGCATSHYDSRLGSDQPAQAFWGNAQSVIPARISYYLNLFGPAIAVDTACSSSLVAVHLACQALWAGEIRMALAGGVFVQCTTAFLDSCNRARMLSPAGRCFTFDSRADGFVPGEGVGVVALKRLSDAIADGDHLYGVICGSGMNQDGSTNGITAPSALAQERLEKAVYDRFGIDPASIGLVEAHGTGTKLGDPIEFAALSRTFASYTDRRNYCAIGSVKSNIGHAATAAGIAGLLKALLSIHHRQIPPSLNFETANAAIDFDASPFHVNTALQPWTVSSDQPRRAAVSSFGFSGTNAHLVLEEAPAIQRSHTERPAYVIALSARTQEQLKQVAQRLLDRCAIAGEQWHLGDVSFTLLTGRKHWNHRLACVVRNVEELRGLLSKWLEGNSVSQISLAAHDGPIRERPSMLRYGNQCIRDCAKPSAAASYLENLAAVADLYTQGYSLDFARLFDKSCRRVSLPAYPFARDVYWVDQAPRPAADARLHPLVHRNVSTLERQRFSSSLSAVDPVLGQHSVLGEPTLPAVAYLEMAVAALAQSNGQANSQRQVRLRNVVWVRPLRAREQVNLSIELAVHADEHLEFEVYREGEQRILHAQGVAEWVDVQRPAALDVSKLKNALGGAALNVSQCYEAFATMRIEHGPWFRCIQSLFQGEHELLAELRLPECASEANDQYCLHPALMDSALQAAVAFVMGRPDADHANLPFALKALTVFAPCTEHMWAWVRRAGVDAPLDVQLCDSEGRVCVQLEALSSRRYSGDASGVDTVFAAPIWMHREHSSGPLSEDVERHVVLVNMGNMEPRQIEANLGARCMEWQLPDTSWRDDFEACAQRLLEIVQGVLTTRKSAAASALIQVAVCGACAWRFAFSLSGLLKTLTAEHARMWGQILLLESAPSQASLLQRLQENISEPLAAVVRYRDGQREVRAWLPFEPDEVAQRGGPWRAQGIYLITGGLGGLGQRFAAEILERAPQAKIVLTGRSAPSESQATALAELQRRGEVSYRRADVGDYEDAQRLIREVLNELGALHGVIHSAGVTQDSFVAKKTSAQLAAVLRPKVAGARHLDRATQELDLDFFILCSSGAGTFGNVGQADYAAANAWLDCFAGYRNELVRAQQRRGHTLSVIWPLWEAGGMKTDRETQVMLERRLGMVPMPTAAGLRALHVGLRCDHSELIVMHGHRERIIDVLAHADELHLAQVLPRNVPAAPAGAVPALTTIQAELLSSAAAALSLPREQVGLHDELSRLGFDSIMLTDFANRLNQRFGLQLAPTIFFEYPTLGDLSKHFLQAHADRFTSPAGTGATLQPDPAPSLPMVTKRFASRSVRRENAAAASDAVAIVGMSGVFPMADDIDALWRNLLDGRDCITEVPAQRWSWRALAESSGTDEAVRWGGFISGMEDFDPLFFKISPKEAELMDPQQRLMMMHLYRAIEDAGYAPRGLSGRNIGIFMGTGNTGYANLIESSGAAWDSYSATGLIPSLGPNRMSYFLDLHGPSEPIETACSSSLVALHRARAEILSGRCEAALVGGVNTLATPESYVRYAKAGMLSPDGRCKTFSAHASGYARGEGVGVLFIKRLEDAQRAGDHIYALVRGSAVNHGGRANSLTAPNAKAQAQLLKQAYSEAGVSIESVGYIETHGTGTPLGDPVEINGLRAAFNDLSRDRTAEPARAHCGLGSIKSNIGHLELAAGVAGIIKVVLQLQHRTLVKSLHCEEPNPYLDLTHSPFFLVRENQAWSAPEDAHGAALPRRAGVSSFGFGGTNAHAILEEYSAAAAPGTFAGPAIVPLSARTPAQLSQIVGNLVRYLQRAPTGDLHSIAYTLQVGRDAFEERIGFIVSSIAELRSQLDAALALWKSERKWPRDAKRDAILDQWLSGADVDWQVAYPGPKPRRVSLPTYPFVQQRFWIGTTAAAEPARLQMFTPVWSVDDTWVDTGWLDTAVHLNTAAMVLIVGGTPDQVQKVRCEFPHAQAWHLQPGESIESIRERLGERCSWSHIIWIGQAHSPQTVNGLDRAASVQSEGVLQVFALVKAMAASGRDSQSLDWTFITTGTQGVHGSDITNPADASLHGFVGSMIKEFPRWSARLIDLPADGSWPEKSWWRLPPNADGAYAYRNGRWFTQTLAPVRELPHESAPYRKGGVYAVVGGAGGLGMLWSRYVIERYQAKVFWIGRRALDDSISHNIAQLARIGPTPTYLQADGGDPTQLARAYARIREEHSAIHGVIHSVVGDFDLSLSDYDAGTFRSILAAKVDVALSMSEIFAVEPLDFLLFFSSMASFSRSGGMSAYSAGCAFEDAYARWLRANLGLRAKVVNWGYWDIGSGTRISEAMKIRLRQEGIEPIDPVAGMAALQRFLASPLDQLLVWTGATTMPATEAVTVYRSEIPSLLAALS